MNETYRQISLDEIRPGLDRPVAVLRGEPAELEKSLALHFTRTRDDLDYLHAAVFQTSAGKQFALTRHEGAPEPGVTLVANENALSLSEELHTALSTLGIGAADLTWVHPDISPMTSDTPLRFEDFQLSDDVQQAIKAAGYNEPTPIQEQTIPLILEGKDIIGSAQTGTGKTAAFALPLLTRLNKAGGTRALIIEPTRELALQVEAAFRTFARFSPLRVGVMYGGVGYGKQAELLEKGMDIWVVTPGRALDYLERGTLSFKDLEIVVLDEADRLLDMGFLPDIRRMLEQCPKNRQTLLFSATIPPEIEGLVKWAMKDPVTISIGMRRSPAETVTHALYPVASAQKFDLLHAMLEQSKYESVIVFTRMKSGADQVAARLLGEGHKVAALHSDRNQSEREEALAGFREGRYEVLVATDIASRGLDIAGVTHVINFDVPQHPEDYVHRIGRTGRAKTEGDAMTIFTAEDVQHVQAIERFIERPIDRVKLPDFKYLYTALFELKAGASLEKIRVSGGRSGSGYSYSSGNRKRR